MIINESGGGAGLNLKIVGNPKPTNPKGNTIWVNTDTEINGYAFSATEPENPVEGMVWFDVGTDSTASMNVDKKNTVMLYPIGCKQYLSDAWADKTAETYLNGEWLEWLEPGVYLYRNGEQYSTITGGWKTSGEAVLESETIWVQGTGASNRAYTNNYLSVAAYSTIYITVKDFSPGSASGKLSVLLVDSGGSSLADVSIPAAGEYVMNIESVTKNCQLWLRCASTAYMSARISKIRMV